MKDQINDNLNFNIEKSILKIISKGKYNKTIYLYQMFISSSTDFYIHFLYILTTYLTRKDSIFRHNSKN